MSNNNISDIKNCFGCGVCVIACPKKIIDIAENLDGFYSPKINNIEECINCGKCLKVCAYHNINIDNVNTNTTKYYEVWSNNPLIRHSCSSGGVGFEIGVNLIEKGYKACGVKYNPDTKRAEHFIANTAEEYIPSIGSKYIPSNTTIAFKQIKKDEKYFVTGTPCQISSFRRYIKNSKIENNFILMDFFCHGVPSLRMFDKYLNLITPSVSDSEEVSWRNKQDGWHDSWVMSVYPRQKRELKDLTKIDNRYFSKLTKGDLFYKFFLQNLCLAKACYSDCKYKMTYSDADIRIGDLWGKKYASNREGVSSVITFTRKGEEVIKSLRNCFLEETSREVATEGQMKRNAKKPFLYSHIKRMIKGKRSLNYIDIKYRVISLPHWLYRLPKRVVRKVLSLIS